MVEHSIESRTGFAHLVFPATEKILRESGLELTTIDCFAASTGPGAFTGLRVALAAVKGLAEVSNKPAVGVSKLRAMASFGTGRERMVLLDARRGEVFAAVYNGRLEATVAETVTRSEEWLTKLPPGDDYQLITENAGWLQSVVKGTRFESAELIQTPRNLAGAIAACAEADLADGDPGDPSTLDANYVRRSDAELYWSDN